MSPCDTCHGGCCRSFAITVTGADILRIERQLDLNFWDFVCRWQDHDGKIAKGLAPHFYFEDEPETPFALCTLPVESSVFPGTTKCRFLTECPPDAEHPRGLARCGIYRERPSACRIFPTRLSDSGQLAILHDVPPRGRASGSPQGNSPAYDLCSRPWTPEDVDPIDSLQDLIVARFELLFFHQLAKLWNAAPQSWLLFPEFLHYVYENRVVQCTPTGLESEMPATIPFRRAA